MTAGAPTGPGITVKRINEVTKNAQGATSSTAIANAIAPKTVQLPLDKDISLVGPGHITNAWQILDLTQPAAECAAVCTLMKTQLDMIGLPGAEVRYVYARTYSWDGIYQYTNTGFTWEIGFYNGGFSKRALVMTNGGDSADFFEGTCYFNGQYWMGNIKTTPISTAATVLYLMTYPSPKRQAWAYTKDNFTTLPTLGTSTVPYPPGYPPKY